jgi:acyl-coenzyme A synthetase/AMP-(fatty) acid ligase
MDDQLNTIGQPIEGVEISILSDSLREVPRLQRGLIAVRFKNEPIEVNYLGQDRSWKSGLRDGYFIPGDVGYISENGNLIYEGRTDDMMIFNGINIFPAEIERAMAGHEHVLEAAAFGIPSAVSGQVPCVALVLKRDLSFDLLMQEFHARLGSRAPRHIFKVPRLPRNPMGKVLRRELVRMARDVMSRKN